MSYEGYVQVLCEKGHYSTYDAYDYYADDNEGEPWKCSICGSKQAWRNPVDETNGSHDEDWDEDGHCTRSIRIDGYVELEEAGFEDVWHEDHYGNKYATKLMLYKIPNDD